MMRSKFDTPLTVESGGGVAASGEFTWEDKEEKAVVEVSIFQESESGQLTKSATGKAVFMKSDHPDSWALTAASEPPPHQLKSGKALAAGIVCALGKEIDMRQFVWSQAIELK